MSKWYIKIYVLLVKKTQKKTPIMFLKVTIFLMFDCVLKTSLKSLDYMSILKSSITALMKFVYSKAFNKL